MRVEHGKLKLSGAERAAFFARDWPELAGEGKPPELTVTTYALSSRLSFTVERIHRLRKAWRVEYSVNDDREERFFLLPSAQSLEIDEETGQVAHLPVEEEIGYTKNPLRNKADPLPAVSPDVQKVLDMRARLQDAQRIDEDQEKAELRNRQQARAINRALTQYAVWAARTGISAAPLFAQIERLLSEYEEEQDAA